MLCLFKKIKRMRNCVKGLALLKSGVEVRLRQAEWFLGWDDLPEERKIACHTIKKYSEQILREIDNIQSGKM